MPLPDLDTLCVNTIRTLSLDAVQQANSDGFPLVALARSAREKMSLVEATPMITIVNPTAALFVS